MSHDFQEGHGRTVYAIANSTLWKLYYGGETYETFDGTVLDDISDSKKPGVIKFRLKDDRWLQLVVRPGVTIALEQALRPSPPDRIR